MNITDEELEAIIRELPAFALEQQRILREQIELGDRVFGKVIEEIFGSKNGEKGLILVDKD